MTNLTQTTPNVNTPTVFLAKQQAILDKWIEWFSGIDGSKSVDLRIFADSEYRTRTNSPNLMIGSTIFAGELLQPIWIEHHGFRSARPLRVGECYPAVLISPPCFLDLFNLKWSSDLGYKLGKNENWLTIELVNYHSGADILSLFPESIGLYLQMNLKQDGAIAQDLDKFPRGTPIGFIQLGDRKMGLRIKVIDTSKCGAPGSLKEKLEAVGVTMGNKNKLDDWKSRMDVAYLNPELQVTFLDYAMDDAIYLPKLIRGHNERYQVLGGKIGLPEDMLETSKEYLSVGRMIADLFMNKLTHVCRITSTDPDEGHRCPWDHLVRRSTDPKTGMTRETPFDLKDLLGKASVQHFAGLDSDKAHLAIVQGGLAKNFRPTRIGGKGVWADWDVAGAYLTCQLQLTYPLGIPHTYGLHENSKQKRMTVRQFMAKHEAQLIPRLWFLSVSGKLNFHQTLIPSKVTDKQSINRYREEDQAHIPGHFSLYTQEIINGVVTSDVFEIMKAVCSKKEFSQFLDLEVVAGAWYPLSHRCDSPEHWDVMNGSCGNDIIEEVQKDGSVRIIDTRSRYWFGFPLKDLLDPWGEARSEWKAKRDVAEKAIETCTDPEELVKLKAEYSLADKMQTAYKLANNTNYGVQASPLLPVANVVTANNITALCRSMVWLAVVACNGAQTITDGFAYDLNKVHQVDKRYLDRRSMDTVSRVFVDPDSLSHPANKLIKEAPLGGSQWLGTQVEPGKVALTNGEISYSAKKEKHKPIDDLVTQHIRDFWIQLTGIELAAIAPIKSAHKHVWGEAYFHSQTNYLFRDFTGKDGNLKARGHLLGREHYYLDDDLELTDHEAPYKTFIAQLAEHPDRITPLPPMAVPLMVKVNQANRGLNNPTSLYSLGLVRAGDTVSKQVWIRPISLSPFWWQTHEQREKWEKHHDRLKQTTGWGVEQQFLNEDGSVDYARAIVEIQAAINQGKDWVRPIDNKSKYKGQEHPYLSESGKHSTHTPISLL